MWFVIEACGIICIFITYGTVFTVQLGMIRIGIWEDLIVGNYWAYLHLSIFLFNVAMIIASHFKCMTSEPGFLPKDYEELESSKLPHELSQALEQIQAQLLLEQEEEGEEKPNEKSDQPALLNSQDVQDLKNGKTSKYQSIMSKVSLESQSTSASLQSEATQARVAVNEQNVKFLDKILSKKCKKCNSIKPPKSHHCSICKRCIARMDHHCPWVNNCVGFYTQKHFILFLIYVFNGSMHALYLIAKNSLYCLDKNCALFAQTSTVVLGCISVFLALLFGLFVSIMFCDQISCIVNNTSTIDKLQKQNPKEKRQKKKSACQRLDDVFSGGRGFSIWWFIPTDVPKKLYMEGEFE